MRGQTIYPDDTPACFLGISGDQRGHLLVGRQVGWLVDPGEQGWLRELARAATELADQMDAAEAAKPGVAS